MDHKIYDVIIIGAGPAGASAALKLAGNNLKVAIIDKSEFPREKICGDAIPSLALKALNYLDQNYLKKLRTIPKSDLIKSSEIYLEKNKGIQKDWLLETYNISRYEFDNFLVDLIKSRKEIICYFKNGVKSFEVNSEGVKVYLQDGQSLSSDLLIVADGANGISNRFLKLNPINYNSCLAVSVIAKLSIPHKSYSNLFYLTRKYIPGYLWIFPLGDSKFNIGFGMYNINAKLEDIKNIKKIFQEITQDQEFINEFGEIQFLGKIKGFPNPLDLGQEISYSSKRILISGDAASLVDPLMGHGIDKAMWSGIYAAETALLSIKNKNFSANFLKIYDKKINNKLRENIKVVNTVLNLFTKFPLIFNLIPLLTNLPLIRKIFRIKIIVKG